MKYRVYLSPPDVGELEEEYVLDALRSGWVAPLGPHVDAFERELASFVGVEHAVALSSGTSGLHLGLLALGVGPGDEVVVPTMTFAATAFAVRYIGAAPVFIDSELTSFNLDPELLGSLLAERAATGRLPAAVIVVDLYGQTADYDRILPLCAEYGVPVLEDAAEALGACHQLGMAGSLGRIGVFSFNGNKIMTTSGGGMLVTDDPTVAARTRYLATQARQPVSWYEHEDVGFNYRMSNVLASLGRAQLIRLPAMIDARQSHRSAYQSGLLETPLEVLSDAPWGVGNAWLTVARSGSIAPSTVIDALAREGVEARRAWMPMHRQPVFRGATAILNGVTDSLFDDAICLPSGSSSSPRDIAEVCAVIRSSIDVEGPERATP